MVPVVTIRPIRLAELADVVLVTGVEVQNTVKAMYGADILAGAGHYSRQRKAGQQLSLMIQKFFLTPTHRRFFLKYLYVNCIRPYPFHFDYISPWQ